MKLEAVPAREVPDVSQLSRSARLAVGAALAAAMSAACGGNSPDSNLAPPYGIPPPEPPVETDAGVSDPPTPTPEGPEGAQDAGGVPAAMYGVPPQ